MPGVSGVEVTRVGEHVFEARNERGAAVRLGRAGQDGVFSPVELLLAAAAGCAAVTAENLVVRRVGDLSARAEEVRAEGGHELAEVPVALDYDLSALDGAQREALAVAVRRAVEGLCTVTRTLKLPVPAPLALPEPQPHGPSA
ncbi:OsmC family protein [Actinosynnema mirum]|uniref:OsmC family protein n=1 Tax=Actinosynnema mirum (strain ATCC 29888 / DSM 43827 / JCM 3225 / NBRC 14064 / NCIMB 13271 / NRRL B-12336 / IMRU 3971 / 101) TaxID=446462 RepID=C6WNQ5_ACTMD|nr:OsmC family protein [Actinosynnema mirum DSM 43827]AXX28345.1 hypothetical protein APASM_0980 [Actinosynnema pretiosum subsp. pretiosum]